MKTLTNPITDLKAASLDFNIYSEAFSITVETDSYYFHVSGNVELEYGKAETSIGYAGGYDVVDVKCEIDSIEDEFGDVVNDFDQSEMEEIKAYLNRNLNLTFFER